MEQPASEGKKRRGRRENPIRGTGPVADIARDLRALRDKKDLRNYELAILVPCAPSTLSKALGGQLVPPWTVTKAIVQACEGDVAKMEQCWKAAKYQPPLPSSDPAAPTAATASRGTATTSSGCRMVDARQIIRYYVLVAQ